MKPRLESARDTHEDADIWVRLLMRQPRQGAYLRFTMWGMYRDADRRSADLMLSLGQFWRVCDDPPCRHLACAWVDLAPYALELRAAAAHV